MRWEDLLTVVRRVCAEQGGERRVLLVLPDVSLHVREVLGQPAPDGKPGDVLGFVVYKDDPALSQRTDDTQLVFVRPERVERVVVTGVEDGGRALGFREGA